MSLDFERGRAAERNRFTAILSSPEAKHQMEFAAHLALNTDATPAAALAALRQGRPAGYSPEELTRLMNSRGQRAAAANSAELTRAPNQKGAAPWGDIAQKLNKERGF